MGTKVKHFFVIAKEKRSFFTHTLIVYNFVDYFLINFTYL
ncbi:hypothetical protein HMPREF1551_02504 [Capnocytophaga sp. oral taxon 863 str. F0517]|nr:hypothetical protein HMPREF1551_02504 [Capnocytophaga sp. oral taxon 863 str. F0517]